MTARKHKLMLFDNLKSRSFHIADSMLYDNSFSAAPAPSLLYVPLHC